MTLIERLREISSNRQALVGTRNPITYGELLAEAEVLAPRLQGHRLLVNLPDPSLAIRVLAAADGHAVSLALVSPVFTSFDLAEFSQLCGADVVVSNRGDLDALPMIDGPKNPFAADASVTRTKWVMTTSGTTGRPKLITHDLESLTRTTRSDLERGKRQVWGLLYDWSRFAGLQVVLQSLVSGATLCTPAADLPLSARLGILARAGCTHLSATPTLWRKILMTEGHEAMPLVQITLGGEIADDAVLAALGRRWPAARISHIFASTEAGVGFSVTDRRAGFPAAYLTQPPAGTEIKVEEGRLFLRSRPANTVLPAGGELSAREGWVDTGDLVSVDGDRVLFRGRASGVINVGGDKVYPEEVERVILSHPNVRLARAYSKANAITGALVAADIVPASGVDDITALKVELQTYLSRRLARHMVPAFVRVVTDFDTNAAGKVPRM